MFAQHSKKMIGLVAGLALGAGLVGCSSTSAHDTGTTVAIAATDATIGGTVGGTTADGSTPGLDAAGNDNAPATTSAGGVSATGSTIAGAPPTTTATNSPSPSSPGTTTPGTTTPATTAPTTAPATTAPATTTPATTPPPTTVAATAPVIALTSQRCSGGSLIVALTANANNSAYQKDVQKVAVARQNEYNVYLSYNATWLGSETGNGDVWNGTLVGNTQGIGKTLRVTATATNGKVTTVEYAITAPC